MEKKNVTACVLKGIHLLEDLYSDLGSRFMSDIDLLIPLDKVDLFHSILIDNGYKLNPDYKFYGNNFKSDWSKLVGEVEVNIELHTNLFYHTQYNENWNFVNSKIKNFKKLLHEDCIIHLCGHLAFQHTFQKLHWLFDIHFYVEKFGDQIDWKLLKIKSEKLKLSRSVNMCLWLNLKYFKSTKYNLSLKKEWWQLILTKDFLLNPEKNKIQYFIIKHATKDRLLDAFYYDLTWFWHYKVSRIWKLLTGKRKRFS
jgi:hypothetical protein